MESKDTLGDRMKSYESASGSDQRFLPTLPVMARLDGKAFHTFTKGLSRPYDERLHNLMAATTSFLVEETGANIGYTQSDEISLVWHAPDYHSEIFFAGRIFKMISILAAKTTLYFNQNLASFLPEKAGQCPLFDCRAFMLPSRSEVVNALLWRQNDATRNSVSMAAQSAFPHKDLQGKSCSQMKSMLSTAGVQWDAYPEFFKFGVFFQKYTYARPFTTSEINKLPPKHAARTNPDLVIERQEIRMLNLPKLCGFPTSVANMEGVIFNGEKPEILRFEKETIIAY